MQCGPQEYETCDSGCNAGLMTSTFVYTFKAGGFEREIERGGLSLHWGPCKFEQTKIFASVVNFSVIFVDEDQIAAIR
ncbi:hypothetical protein V6N13_032400 [Hibiscus sabdariffa]|uniref:Uncharacterized protein n=1 Tax=Hibiscus sabdariffa TaxID=183260 RepID=A0ABR2C191_9ROSI